MKRGLKILLLLVLLLVVALASVPFWIDSVARGAVQDGATEALGVETTLDSMNISIFGGSCTLEGLTIDNPEGFRADNFFQLGDGSVSVSLGSLMKDKVVLPELTLSNVTINLEREGLKSNYGKILDNLEKGEKEPAPESGKKFVIEQVIVRNIEVEARVSAVGLVKPAVRVTIPEIRLQNIGSDTSGGAVMGTVVRQILKGILDGVLKAGGALPKEITEGLGKGLKAIGGVGSKVIGDVGETAGKAVKGVGDKIGGLFGGKKKDKDKKDD